MKAVHFDGSNASYASSQPQYLTLPVRRCTDDNKTVISVWEFTEEERLQIANGENLELAILTFGRPLQPVSMRIVDKGQSKYHQDQFIHPSHLSTGR